MIFEYAAKRTFDESIDILDIGNTAIKCISTNLDEYYLITKTVMGKVSVIKFGPVVQDLDVLINDFSASYKKIDYKEIAIRKEIDKFINDFRKEINSIEEVTEFEAWQAFPDVHRQFTNI